MRGRLAVLAPTIALTLAGVLALASGLVPVAPAAAQVDTTHAALAQPVDPTSLLELARRRLEEAERLDARKFMPSSHRVARAAVTLAQEIKGRLQSAGASDTPEFADAAREADRITMRLLGWTRFVHQAQRNPQPWETLAEALDQALLEILRAGQIVLVPGATLPTAAQEIGQVLAARQARNRAVTDSLAVVARRARHQLQAEDAVQESTMTALRAEVSSLRRELWNADQRAGSLQNEAAAAQRSLEQQRAEAGVLQRLERLFAPGEGEIHLTPAGVVFRVQGLDFASGSSDLRPSHDKLLDKVIQGLQLFPGRKLRVDGHTDDTGGRDANLKLSRARAEQVARRLIQRMQIAPDRVSIVGYGPDRPVAPNANPEARARNRRIEIVVLPEG